MGFELSDYARRSRGAVDSDPGGPWVAEGGCDYVRYDQISIHLPESGKGIEVQFYHRGRHVFTYSLGPGFVAGGRLNLHMAEGRVRVRWA